MLRLLTGVGVSLVVLTGCDATISGGANGAGGQDPGNIAGPGGGSSAGGATGPSASDPNAVGPRPLTRLSRREYDNTVRDLLGDDTKPASEFPDDRDRAFLFRRAGLVATQDADLLRTAAESLAATVVKAPAAVLPCDPAAGETACAAQFISEFGKRAYRRPLSDAERTRLQGLYDNARGALAMTFNEAIGVLVEALLQAPAFLYHWESPYEAPVLEGGVVKLAPYDVASRLSYFIWGSMPDAALFDAAAAGKLASDAELTAQAKRMLADGKAKGAAAAFFSEWLELDRIAELPKSTGEYPEYTDALKADMLGETSAFVQNVLFEGGGRFETLLTADFTFSNQALGTVYGSGSGTTLSKAMLDTSQRLGLLTQPSFLALTGSPDGSNPVKRGKAVYEKVLCGLLPPPPAKVPPAKPASAGGTTRERFAEHGQNECARGCHVLMDPLGFAFEHYDGIGRYRTMDNGKPVDSTSQVTIDGSPHQFADAVELTRVLATSETARSCFATQWFRFAFSRSETDFDQPSLSSIAAAFAANQYDVRDLAPAIAASRSFRFRSLVADEVRP